MLQTPDRIEVKPPALHWEGILQQWIFLNKEIFNSTDGEVAAYSYREGPNIGVMAGAAVKAGWVALEQCWSEKKNAEQIFDGRADLMLWRGVHNKRI
ncbi:MAG TPA: hypothetical protein VLX11_14905, partial [Candidatus Acidoferrales bacterium]|nr:hypothetical protein [Candidatus Acidoferrales bacterium]